MSLFSVPKETNHVALLSKRDVTLTMPWFSELSKYPPRAANVVNPLINGERAFGAAYEAIKNAKKSIDMIGWGFDPSMRFLRPNGLRIGELLQQKAKAGVEVRVLVWKNALANFGENNIIGDGMGGSGGGTGLGSGIGRTGATDANQGGEYNDYGGKRGSGKSGAIQQRDADALAFNRAWFAADVNLKKLSFRTRDFSKSDQDGIAERHVGKHGMDGHMQRIAFVNFPSHHQKMILVDYEVPEDAVGFVMGHEFDAGQDRSGRLKGLKVEHGSSAVLDRSMVLLDDVVEVFDLADHDLVFQSVIEVIDRRLVGAALVHHDDLTQAMQPHGLLEKAPGSGLVAFDCQQVIDRVAVLVHRTVQIFPDAFDLDVGFVHAPASTNRALVFAEHLFQQRQKPDCPSADRRMVHRHASHHAGKLLPRHLRK